MDLCVCERAGHPSGPVSVRGGHPNVPVSESLGHPNALVSVRWQCTLTCCVSRND